MTKTHNHFLKRHIKNLYSPFRPSAARLKACRDRLFPLWGKAFLLHFAVMMTLCIPCISLAASKIENTFPTVTCTPQGEMLYDQYRYAVMADYGITASD